MPKTAATSMKTAGISDAAVHNATGKGWEDWFAILDKAGAAKMTHKEMAAYLFEQHLHKGWWCQMIVVAYEQARGRRVKYETLRGYEITVSRTLEASAPKLYQACYDAKLRGRWLPEKGLTLRSTKVNQWIRINWSDGKTRVEFHFLPKGAAKCQVVAGHHKLASAKAAAKMKTYWAAALERLKKLHCK